MIFIMLGLRTCTGEGSCNQYISRRNAVAPPDGMRVNMYRFSVRRALGAGVAGSAVALALTLGGAIPGIASAAPAAPVAAARAMAGPFSLAPGETQTQIPTFILGKITHVVIDCQAAGKIELRAGGSLAETDQCNAGNNEFDRNFGGVFLAVKNDTSANITVTTH